MDGQSLGTVGAAVSAALVASAALVGCLPGDTRPEPGSLLVATAPSTAAVDGVTTADGWSVSFERLLAGVGSVQLGGVACNGYGEPRYTRLFDFSAPMEAPQKVALVYGLGECDLGFELSPPERDALLGPGVTSADLELMRTEADDAWNAEPERTGVFVIGTATRGSTTKRFEWKFRKEYDLEKCAAGADGKLLQLAAGEALEVTIVVDAAELLRPSVDPEAPLGFDAIAASDADGDGVITMDELDAVAAPPSDDPEEAVDADKTLADLLYRTLVPRMARPLGGEVCHVEVDDR